MIYCQCLAPCLTPWLKIGVAASSSLIHLLILQQCLLLWLFVGKFKEKAETLNNVARRTAESKTEDKSEGKTEGCDGHPLIGILSLSFHTRELGLKTAVWYWNFSARVPTGSACVRTLHYNKCNYSRWENVCFMWLRHKMKCPTTKTWICEIVFSCNIQPQHSNHWQMECMTSNMATVWFECSSGKPWVLMFMFSDP